MSSHLPWVKEQNILKCEAKSNPTDYGQLHAIWPFEVPGNLRLRIRFHSV